MSPWLQRAARWAYSLLLTLLAPLYVLRLEWRGRAEPTYRRGIGERFGLYAGAGSGVDDDARLDAGRDAGLDADAHLPTGVRRGAPPPGCVWVHAVSLGETHAAAALIDALRALRPDVRLLLTHGTATGRDAGAALLRDGDAQAWLPYDAPWAVRRFFRHFRPALGVLMETEIWPNLLVGAQTAAVPMVLANARLSARSRRAGARVDAVIRPAFETLALVLAQTEGDALRLRDAGACNVGVSGNLKFDMAPDPALLARGRAWRDAARRGVVLAAVFREGEDAMLLAAWQRVAAPRPLLVIVPRHPQRFDAVAALVEACGLTLRRRSAWNEAPPAAAWDADVWLGDSLGEMPLYYAASHVALMGGSFAPLGSHNLIEAAACGCPVVLGPSTFNFAEAARLALGTGAAVRVADMPAGVDTAVALLASGEHARHAARALAFAARHRGAAGRMAAAIVDLM